ncbi:TPA: hypothetical protein SL493_002015, partial [Pseudomonas aeruginosa]|nr:hypothetical protein [Pseudomonas aeruginosa]
IAKILLQGQPVHGVEQQLAGALGPERMAVSAKVGSMRVLQRDRDCLVHPVPLQGVAIGGDWHKHSDPTRQNAWVYSGYEIEQIWNSVCCRFVRGGSTVRAVNYIGTDNNNECQ